MINESQSDSESTTQLAKAPNSIEQVHGSSSGDNIEEQSAKKFRGPNKEYFKQKEYETYQEAKIDMKTLQIRGHKLVYSRKRFKQHKVFYKCQKGCPIQAYIKLSEYNQTCELWITSHEHYHTNASQNLLPLASKQKVIEYSNLSVKPKEIVRSIREEGNLVQLTFQQIYNIRNYEKAKRLGDTKMI